MAAVGWVAGTAAGPVEAAEVVGGCAAGLAAGAALRTAGSGAAARSAAAREAAVDSVAARAAAGKRTSWKARGQLQTLGTRLPAICRRGPLPAVQWYAAFCGLVGIATKTHSDQDWKCNPAG